jgi:hypothetical protein
MHDDDDDDDDDDPTPQHEEHQVFVARSMVGCENHVRLADAKKASGFLILDTACQRFCDGWQRMVRCLFRRAETMECCSSHQGQPLQASHRLLFPAALGEACVVIAPCILDAQIPCLASRTLLTDVGAAIDLGKHVVHFTRLNTSVNLQIVNGHVGINIADFSSSPQALQLWNVFCHDCLKEGNQHMHEEYINLTPLASQSTLADASSAESFISQFDSSHGARPSPSSTMDNKLANPGEQGNDLGKAGSEILADPYITAYDNGINRAVNDKEPETTMSAQVHQAKRQSPRKLRTMSGGSTTKDGSNTQNPLVPHHCHCLPPPQLCWTAHGKARQHRARRHLPSLRRILGNAL